MSWMRPVAMNTQRRQRESPHYKAQSRPGLVRVRTVGPCAQRRVAFMPRAIALAKDTLSNNRRESATCFERPAKQALALATEP